MDCNDDEFAKEQCKGDEERGTMMVLLIHVVPYCAAVPRLIYEMAAQICAILNFFELFCLLFNNPLSDCRDKLYLS
jgi:hypothetical protein